MLLLMFISFRLPEPSIPPLSLIPNVLLDSFVITLVSYTISMSMALIFAQKAGYEVDANQELVAQVSTIIYYVSTYRRVFSFFLVSFFFLYTIQIIKIHNDGYNTEHTCFFAFLFSQGLGNLFGSFFSCMPFTASLSRSLIQETVGGHTQLASLISCSILISVLLWIGPFFEPLPRVIFTYFYQLY